MGYDQKRAKCKPDSVCLIAKVATIYLSGIPALQAGTNYRTCLFCLAPGRVCPSGAIASIDRALLPHVFTLTLLCSRAVIFCGTFHRVSPSSVAAPVLCTETMQEYSEGTLFVRSPDFPLTCV